MILILLGCSSGGVLDAVASHLADDVLVDAAPMLHRVGAIALLAGEITMSESPTEEYFDGIGARMLGAGLPEVTTEDDGSLSFTFEDVGTEGELGTLTLDTLPSFATFEMAFQWSDGLISGDMATVIVDDFVAVNGLLAVESSTGGSSVGLNGEYPFLGLAFDPWKSDPGGGQLTWTRVDASTKNPDDLDTLALKPAEGADFSQGWPGVAHSRGWTREVVVDWP